MLKCTGIVPNASAEKLFREVFHQDFHEKKRLGQDFLVSDEVLEQLESHPENMILVRRQEFKLVWPMSNRVCVIVCDCVVFPHFE